MGREASGRVVYTDGRRVLEKPNILLNGKWYYNCTDEKIILAGGWRRVEDKWWVRLWRALIYEITE